MLARLAIIGTLLVALAAVPRADAELKPATRITILRALVAEFGALQAPLPRGEKGLFLRSDGAIDVDRLTHELTQQGTAIPTSTIVQITQIFFRDKELVFEINGGPKKKTKWYERIEVGVGSRTTPINNPNADDASGRGSLITLVFPEKLQDITVDEVKSYLAPILDFEAKNPILGMTAAVPPEFKQAIEEKRAAIGMSPDMVLAALGPPESKIREVKNGVEQEDWIYGAPPMKVLFVTFENDEVVNVQEYAGGIRGETFPSPEQPPR